MKVGKDREVLTISIFITYSIKLLVFELKQPYMSLSVRHVALCVCTSLSFSKQIYILMFFTTNREAVWFVSHCIMPLVAQHAYFVLSQGLEAKSSHISYN